MMQSSALSAYLAASEGNFAVLNDYVSMEAYKGSTLTSVFKSMEIVSRFPRQVIVLKTTGRVCSLIGRNQGLQRRMIDESQTREFPVFCRRLKRAQEGDVGLQRQLLESGRYANEQMSKILDNVPILPGGISELRKTFSTDELRAIRLGDNFPQSLISKAMSFIIDLTYATFASHPSPPPRIANIDELQNAFLFRHAVATFVWALDWIARGGASDVRTDRMRNDVVDVIFVAYGTFFDGLLSNDTKLLRVFERTKFILSMLKVYGHTR